MEKETGVALMRLTGQWGWKFVPRSIITGVSECSCSIRLDEAAREIQKARAHAFAEPDTRNSEGRYRATFRFDPELHAMAAWIVIYLVAANKVYRFSRGEFDSLVKRAESRGNGWINDPQRGYRANIYADSDELHPVGEDARLSIAEYLDPRRSKASSE